MSGWLYKHFNDTSERRESATESAETLLARVLLGRAPLVHAGKRSISMIYLPQPRQVRPEELQPLRKVQSLFFSRLPSEVALLVFEYYKRDVGALWQLRDWTSFVRSSSDSYYCLVTLFVVYWSVPL